MKKSLILLGHFSLIVTAILAIFFYKERVFFNDPGQQVFEMINNGGFKVFVNRYSMVINQVFPLLAIKIGLPLKYIVIIYSLSFVLVYYICFLISVHGFKNIEAGLGVAFMPILIRADFGHSISEAWLGMAYSAVFYAILNYYHQWKSKGNIYVILFYLSICLMIVINYFIHPITLFTLLFSVGLTYFLRKEYKSPHIYIVAFLVTAPYLIKFIFPDHSHDGSFFAGIKMADQLLPHIFQLPLWKFIVGEFQSIYIFALILILVSGFVCWKTKKLTAFIFSLLFIVFYFIIACLSFYKSPFALESRLMPVAFILGVIFAVALQEMKRNYILISGIVLILSFSFYGLFNRVVFAHSKRIRIYENLLAKAQQYPERKFYIYYTREQDTPVNSWGPAAETLMLSSLEGKENSRSIIFLEENTKIDEGLKYWPCVFMWVNWYLFFPEDQLNKKYFDLKCTDYKELPYSAIE